MAGVVGVEQRVRVVVVRRCVGGGLRVWPRPSGVAHDEWAHDETAGAINKMYRLNGFGVTDVDDGIATVFFSAFRRRECANARFDADKIMKGARKACARREEKIV